MYQGFSAVLLLLRFMFVIAVCYSTIMSAVAATQTCHGDTPPYYGSALLQVSSISPNRDTPLGAIIYRQKYKGGVGTDFDCTSSNKKTIPSGDMVYKYGSNPLNLSSWNSGRYAGKVYLTSVPGIGVTFTSDLGDLPVKYALGSLQSCGYAECDFYTIDNSTIEILFIKIGVISGGRINGFDLPTTISQLQFNNRAAFRTSTISFRGYIDIITKTCATPDVTVDMGMHSIRSLVEPNSVTSWKSFNIQLIGCPVFPGIYPNVGATWDWAAGNTTPGQRVSNKILIRIDPTNTPVNSSGGILSLNAGTENIAAASGVGLQIADPLGIPLPLSTDYNPGLILSSDSERSYNIPLLARYIRTSSELKPGQAGATATFTINYQ